MHVRLTSLAVLGILAIGGLPGSAAAKTIQVGPGRETKAPSAAVALAADGDVIEIDAATYQGDVAVWKQSNLTLKGVGNGRPVLKAAGQAAQGKAIWVLAGRATRVENIEFADAKVPDKNGAGIRAEGAGLTVVSCVFRNNENGILAGNAPQAELVIERSEFDRNGHEGGYAHGIYIGDWARLIVRGSYFHGTPNGHLLKSRAAENHILYNRLFDGDRGWSSLNVDLSNGGVGYIVGNEIQQGLRNGNTNIIGHGLEGLKHKHNRLYIVNNTIVNDATGGNFLNTKTDAEVLVANNILIGAGKLEGGGQITMLHNLLVTYGGRTPEPRGALDGGPNRGNKVVAGAKLVDLRNDDYRLTAGSPAIGLGADPAPLLAGLQVDQEYLHPLKLAKRKAGAGMDAGAHGFSP